MTIGAIPTKLTGAGHFSKTAGRASLGELTAVILVGGPGTRLRPLTDDLPKSLVPVLNRPVMEHTITYLKSFGIVDIILTLSYLPDAIRERFGDGRDYGARIAYRLEEPPLGTAGAVKNTEADLDGTFVVLNGDIFTDLDLAAMLAFHRERRAAATISLSYVDDPSAYGVVEMDDNRRVQRFVEKPPRDQAASHWINAGTYILDPQVLDHIPSGEHYMFENGLFPDILSRDLPVYGYPYRGYWLDMGTPAKYFTVNMDMLRSRIKSAAGDATVPDGVDYGPDVSVHAAASVTAPTLIGGGCRLGRGARVAGPVIMGRDCRIGEGAEIENSILWDGVRIGAGARLDRCIIASGVSVPAGETLSNTVMTAARSAPLPNVV
jgi:mannose-1-phosphate guanylyltransferase